MKKKFLILTLCFTLVFTSINYKKSYADGGLISLPILATVSSLAVATGIVISGNDDLYDIGYLFYDYVKKHNDLTWDVIKTTFNSSVTVLNNGLVSVDSKFLDICKGFFDTSFSSNNNVSVNQYNIPVGWWNAIRIDTDGTNDLNFSIGDLSITGSYTSSKNYYHYYDAVLSLGGNSVSYEFARGTEFTYYWFSPNTNRINYLCNKIPTSDSYHGRIDVNTLFSTTVSSVTFPYTGGYTWDNVENKKENESVSLPIPGGLGQLVGQGSKDFWDNSDGLVGNGDLSLPYIDNPSIDIDDSIVSFPTVGDTPSDTPSDTPFANITEYIIGLVVPSDTYWTDTWGGLYNNFTSSFPMVDMDNFNNLVTGEKKFPNIDVNIMGVKGRVVNGDVVNSIVDWLRPIIAGFMMLCLMLFNYRKIYKTIRGVEPFQGIAQGTSDFRTGISEYNYMGSGLSKSEYQANEMELAKALHDYHEDTGKTYKVRI